MASPPEDGWRAFGSREGEPLELTAFQSERRFRARLCRQTPDDVEVDVRLAANIEHSGPTELVVSMATPDDERRETVLVEGRARVEVDEFEPLDPELSCTEGVPIAFSVPGPLVEPVRIEWALHYGFTASEELSGTEVVLEAE